MDRRTFASTVLTLAIGLTALTTSMGASAQAMKIPAGANKSVVEANMARDLNSFVLRPPGDCQKIAGGSLKPGM